MRKHLIVNADDLGISQGTNRAIQQAFRHGIVTSASLMANMAAFCDAVDCVIPSNPGLGIGAHLCLTSGKAVSPPGDVSLLVDATGHFRHGFFGLLQLLRSRHGETAKAQIAREFNAQIARIDACGVAIDHVNGHQHVHMLPALFPMVARIAEQRQAAVRIPLARHLRSPLSQRLRNLVTGGVLKTALLRALSRRVLPLGDTLFHADNCLGVGESGRLTLPVLQNALSAAPEGVTEVFSHPGLRDVDLETVACSRADRQFLRSPQRAAELQALLDPAARASLERLGLELVNFGQINPRRKSHDCDPVRRVA